jgi:hypothetical protein
MVVNIVTRPAKLEHALAAAHVPKDQFDTLETESTSEPT